MKNKICVVTGANSGIGRAMAMDLAGAGAQLAMVCRDPGRGREALEAVRAATGNDGVELFRADLSSQGDIRALSAALHERYERVDVLLNNAGVYLPSRRLTEEGREAMMATNHLAPFLLTQLLLDRLEASDDARVVTTSSMGHWIGGRDADDFEAERSYVASVHYGRSKLANILFTRELSRRIRGRGVSVNCFHPGTIATGFAQDEPGWLGSLVKIGRFVLQSPEAGADTGLWLARSPEGGRISGEYFSGRKVRRTSRAACDRALAARLWAWSESVTGA